MGTLLFIGIVAAALSLTGIGVGVTAAAMVRRRDAKALPPALPPPPPRRDLTATDLRVNDVVNHLDDTWIVVGCRRYDHDGQIIRLFLLESGDRACLLRAQRLDTLRLELLQLVDQQPATGSPPRTLTRGGVEYTLKHWGQVRVEHTGQTTQTASRAEFHELRAPGGRVLLIERWGDTDLTLEGRSIEPHHLDLLPGDLVSS